MDNLAAEVNGVDRVVEGPERVGRDPAPPLGLRATPPQIRTLRAQSIGRDVTAVGDLRRWRRDIPDSVGITAGCADSGTRHITYREYAQYVERLAGADFELSAALADIATRLPHLRH
ncbi:MAG: cyclohexanecarboxylate-CoA ligase, partial [Pseudonocardia sp.]